MPALKAFLTKTVVLNVASVIAYLNSLFGSLWGQIVSFLSTNPVGITIAAILSILALLAITTLINIFICGCLQIDYISGIVFHGWFNFEFVQTDVLSSKPNSRPVVFS